MKMLPDSDLAGNVMISIKVDSLPSETHYF